MSKLLNLMLTSKGHICHPFVLEWLGLAIDLNIELKLIMNEPIHNVLHCGVDSIYKAVRMSNRGQKLDSWVIMMVSFSVCRARVLVLLYLWPCPPQERYLCFCQVIMFVVDISLLFLFPESLVMVVPINFVNNCFVSSNGFKIPILFSPHFLRSHQAL